jgi:uncharacterized phage-associated protein
MSFFFFFDGKIPALTLANYILKKAQHQGHGISNLKLQKILYYVQGYYLAKFDEPLFPDEIQAWKLGPVVPGVYYEFSVYGSDDLVMTSEPDMGNCTEEEMQLIDKVINAKIHVPVRQLVDDTHQEDPWRIATSNGTNIALNTEISLSSIKEYFRHARI